MTPDEARDVAVDHWWRQAQEALGSAQGDLAEERLHRAVNSAYYACFYALMAVLLTQGRSYGKHTAVQSALHRDLIATGRLAPAFGTFYDTLMEARAQGDYVALTEFEPGQVRAWINGAEGFVHALRDLVGH